MSPFQGMMRRFSRSSSVRNKNPQQQQQQQQQTPQSPTSYTYQPSTIGGPSGGAPVSSSAAASAGTGGNPRNQALGGDYTTVLPNGGIANDGRPISSATDGSFEFANRPVSGVSTSGGAAMSSHLPQTASGGNLSRTDQVVLKYFWEAKYAENAKRDLHYLKFPYFPQYPGHKDLLPYCEIYHLVKTSPGATIISLGSADGVYIGFELQTGSQLHIDLDDDWFTNTASPNNSITHHRIGFRPYASMVSDPDSATTFRTWPKPLTIEYLEEQYLSWTHDLTSVCWEDKEVRELGATGGNGPAGQPTASRTAVPTGQAGHAPGAGSVHSTTGSARHAGSVGDDGYASERSSVRGI